MLDSVSALVGGAKGAILSALSEHHPQSSKEVWRSLNGKYSYQAVHKALGELERDAIVLKAEAGYSIRSEWLEGVSRESSDALASRHAKQVRFSVARHGLGSAFHALHLLNKLLLSGELKLARDEIMLHGNRVFLIPISLLVQWFDELEASGRKGVVYSSCTALGEEWFTGLRRLKLSDGSIDSELRLGMDAISMSGKGLLNFVEVNPTTKTILVTMDHSPFAIEHARLKGKSRLPVCDNMRGYLAGGMRVILGDKTLDCVETHCIAAGDSRCEFVIKPRKDFDLKDKLVREQLK